MNNFTNEQLERIQYLLSKQEKTILSEGESLELEQWLDAVGFDTPQVSENDFLQDTIFNQRYADVLLRATAKKEKKNSGAKVFRINYKAIAAAAIAIVVLSAVLWLQLFNSEERPATITQIPAFQIEDVLPGTDGAVLSLSDGSKIILDTAKNGLIAKQGGATIDNADGVLSYHAPQSAAGNVEYNTLATPAGRKYQLQLPDGSKVWLNASSSISFPAVFANDARKVIVTGEAYFEVAKAYQPNGTRKPFRIEIKKSGFKKKMAIEVLGTSFNVNAYADEPGIRTTLIEGSVAIHADDKTQALTPSNQAVTDQNGTTRILTSVNINEAIAWKDGLFYFDGTDIKSILRQFSRWYNVDIRSSDSAMARSFSGKISRSMKLADVLTIMDLSDIDYMIQGDQIILKH